MPDGCWWLTLNVR